MKLHNVEQKSVEWFELRKKYPLTASYAQAIGNQGKGLESLCWEKMAELYSSGEKEEFSTVHTERGNELEPQARALYELKTGNTVEEVGFITDESISPVGGASPDGMVGEDGGIEIKCFNDTKFFKMIIENKRTGTFKIETQYEWQMQQQMLFGQRKWVDFVAYNPNFKQSLLIQRVYPDLVKQQKIITGLKMGEKIIREIKENI